MKQERGALEAALTSPSAAHPVETYGEDGVSIARARRQIEACIRCACEAACACRRAPAGELGRGGVGWPGLGGMEPAQACRAVACPPTDPAAASLRSLPAPPCRALPCRSAGKEAVRDGLPQEAFPLLDKGLELALETKDVKAERALVRVRARANRDIGEAAPPTRGAPLLLPLVPPIPSLPPLLLVLRGGCNVLLLLGCVGTPALADIRSCPAASPPVPPPPPLQATRAPRCATCSRAWRCRRRWGRRAATPTRLGRWGTCSPVRACWGWGCCKGGGTALRARLGTHAQSRLSCHARQRPSRPASSPLSAELGDMEAAGRMYDLCIGAIQSETLTPPLSSTWDVEP